MSRLGAGRYPTNAEMPAATTTSVHQLTTSDGARVPGVLRNIPGATTVAVLMHPRQDLTHHGLIPYLVREGYAVWAQQPRSVNNDIALLHEQAILDAAAGHRFLRRHFENVVTVGHSGGGTLSALYHQQANCDPDDRISTTASGRPVPMADVDLPAPDGAIFLAPHPGQGQLLARLIDPSVVDENDPLSRDPDLDPYSPENGFDPEPGHTRYAPDFVARYREAQLARIERIDRAAWEADSATRRARETAFHSGLLRDRQAALAPRIVTVYRTDADLRSVDLTLDPNERKYGSLFGNRPDLTNYGLVGFGRLSTPGAWLSTWSLNHTRADFVRCAPGVTAPTLFLELTGDQACFPQDVQRMTAALASSDLTTGQIRGTHFGAPLHPEDPSGYELAAERMAEWLGQRYGARSAIT